MSRHYSKVDWWLMFLLALALFYAGSFLVLGVMAHHIAWWGAGLYLFMAAIIAAMSWPLYYDVGEGRLTIRMGLFRWRIPLESISRAVPSRAFRKAPALSLDRIQVEYRKWNADVSVQISPTDKESFLDDLVRASKHLRREGNQAVSAGGP